MTYFGGSKYTSLPKGSSRGGISLFYNFLYDKSILKKTNSMLAWEDLNASFSKEEWSKALQNVYSATKMY